VAWERRGAGFYFYRSVRDGGQVRKEYGGAGVFGELAASMAEDERLEREARHQEAEEQIANALAACPPEDQLSAYSEQVDRVVSEAFTSAGFRRHKRGEWRKRRA
jgi:hypothetical protein